MIGHIPIHPEPVSKSPIEVMGYSDVMAFHYFCPSTAFSILTRETGGEALVTCSAFWSFDGASEAIAFAAMANPARLMDARYAINGHLESGLLTERNPALLVWFELAFTTGPPEVQEHWRHVIEEAAGGGPVERIIATHFHPDHLDNAGWLAERVWGGPPRPARGGGRGRAGRPRRDRGPHRHRRRAPAEAGAPHPRTRPPAASEAGETPQLETEHLLHHRRGTAFPPRCSQARGPGVEIVAKGLVGFRVPPVQPGAFAP